MNPKDLDAALCAVMAAHAARAYPAECCGVLTSDAAGRLRYTEIPNIAGTEAAGPTSSRSIRDGYVMDPKALMAALDEADRAGGSLRAIVHSHPDVGAYFSAEDQRAALGGADEPLWPDVAYVVLSCRGGQTDGARLYTWNPSDRSFQEQELPLR
jgi:proteasome lid subunit RPN8/RPN11